MNPLENPESESQLDGRDVESGARSAVPEELDDDVLVIEDEEGDVNDAEAPVDRD